MAADPSRGTVHIGGQQLQIPTQQEQFQTQLGQKRQETEQDLQLQLDQAQKMNQAVGIPLSKKIADQVGLPEGYRVSPQHYAELVKSGADQGKLNEPKAESIDEQAFQTAATVLAQHAGINLDPSKKPSDQIPASLKAQAFQLEKEMRSDPDLKANTLATGASTRATAEMARATAGQTQLLNAQRIEEGKQKLLDAKNAGQMLNTAGKNQLEAITPVQEQVDSLMKELESPVNPKDPRSGRHIDNNTGFAMALPLLKYKMGIAAPEGELGSRISDLSLNAIQAIQPFASKSRNYRYIQDIKQHTPNVATDSPQLMHQKLATIQRNFLKMNASAMRYETQKTSVNPPRPELPPDKAQLYYHLALAGKKPSEVPDAPLRATKMAIEDGYTVPSQ
jgi:hypothetical protein